MRTIFKAVPFLGLALVFAACVPKVKVPEYKPPEFKVPVPDLSGLDDLLKGIQSCSKPEAEQTASAEAVTNTFGVIDKIDVQDIETTDCDGNVKGHTHGPVRSFSRAIKLAAPKVLTGLTFIEVENTRACSRTLLDVSPNFTSPAELKDGSDKIDFAMVSKVGPSGDAHLALSISSLHLGVETNVIEGRNIVVVRYYGKCLQYREKKDEKLGESYNCAKPELLATRDITLQIKTELVEKPGTYSRKSCVR